MLLNVCEYEFLCFQIVLSDLKKRVGNVDMEIRLSFDFVIEKKKRPQKSGYGLHNVRIGLVKKLYGP